MAVFLPVNNKAEGLPVRLASVNGDLDLDLDALAGANVWMVRPGPRSAICVLEELANANVRGDTAFQGVTVRFVDPLKSLGMLSPAKPNSNLDISRLNSPSFGYAQPGGVDIRNTVAQKSPLDAGCESKACSGSLRRYRPQQ